MDIHHERGIYLLCEFFLFIIYYQVEFYQKLFRNKLREKSLSDVVN